MELLHNRSLLSILGLLELLQLFPLKLGFELIMFELLLQKIYVVSEELYFAWEFLFGWVKGILTIQKLYNTAITIPDCMIILYFQTLQMFHQASLKITTSWSLDCSINETLSASHAVEEELLGSQSCQEPVADEAGCTWVGVVGDEGGKGLARDHHGYSPAL